ncbi:MAG: methionine synthase [Proteobacteria bacterium]|nr:methionine synthase [Pseudomonadota bacterium]
MSDQQNQEREADGAADVKAVLGIMAVVIYAAYFWLAGMPT